MVVKINKKEINIDIPFYFLAQTILLVMQYGNNNLIMPLWVVWFPMIAAIAHTLFVFIIFIILLIAEIYKE